MNKRTPEALIANLSRRKLRIIFYVITTILLAFFTATYFYLADKATSKLIITPETENIEAEKAFLAISGPLMAETAANCYTKCLFCAAGLGVAIGALIIELTTYTKDQLLVEMWDRIQEIQGKINKQKE
jgi:hypothetical protein